MLFEVPDEITDMTRSSGIMQRQRLIYGIIVFSLWKVPRTHRKGFRMFLEIFGYENTLIAPRGKAHGAFGKCKRQFCGGQGLDARDRGIWV